MVIVSGAFPDGPPLLDSWNRSKWTPGGLHGEDEDDGEDVLARSTLIPPMLLLLLPPLPSWLRLES